MKSPVPDSPAGRSQAPWTALSLLLAMERLSAAAARGEEGQ